VIKWPLKLYVRFLVFFQNPKNVTFYVLLSCCTRFLEKCFLDTVSGMAKKTITLPKINTELLQQNKNKNKFYNDSSQHTECSRWPNVDIFLSQFIIKRNKLAISNHHTTYANKQHKSF